METAEMSGQSVKQLVQHFNKLVTGQIPNQQVDEGLATRTLPPTSATPLPTITAQKEAQLQTKVTSYKGLRTLLRLGF